MNQCSDFDSEIFDVGIPIKVPLEDFEECASIAFLNTLDKYQFDSSFKKILSDEFVHNLSCLLASSYNEEK